MQDRYAGDVGDFGKFGLLRYLVNDTNYVLGVNWYLYPDETHNEDGRFIRYLKKPSFQKCDPVLHRKLKEVVETDRSVKALENARLLGPEIIYFSETVDFYRIYPGQTYLHRRKRLESRRRWIQAAASALADASVLFIDPDNGVEIESVRMHQKYAGKYAYYEEIKEFHKGKLFSIIYHHLGRNGAHADQIQARARELKSCLNSSHKVYCLRFRPYSPRAFFILASPSISSELERKLDCFLSGPWQEF